MLSSIVGTSTVVQLYDLCFSYTGSPFQENEKLKKINTTVIQYHVCFSVTKEQVAVMKGHDSSIHHISIHASGRYALTSSQDTAQLWDLDTFQRKRKLNIKEDVGIVKVF